MAVCCNPEHKPGGVPYEIPPGDRVITIAQLTIDWGDKDLRNDWTGVYTFDSFECVAAWAAEKAGQHDEHVLVDGEPPEGDEPA